MGFFEFNRALVRAPSDSVVHGLRAGDELDPSLEEIRKEHAAYVRALEVAGLVVKTLPALEEFPDSVFVEDPALVFANGAILLRPGAPTRIGEAAAIETDLRGRFDTVLELQEGHVDGGDVLVTPEAAFIGLSHRTDTAGAAALVRLLARLGIRGRIVDTPSGVLHLKSACSLLDEETVLATRAIAVSGIFDRFRVLTVPEGEILSANALRLNDLVLARVEGPCTIELLERRGHNVLPLRTSEISKLDAGLTCMSLRWRSATGLSGIHVQENAG